MYEQKQKSCGACLQDLLGIKDAVFSLVFVNDELDCESPIEVPYYVAFADPLFLCGSEVDLKSFEAK